ncbi:hypothetical protein AMECASPLE_012883 [Ameca splendens]|uniref:Secreted protein n=1 Tax=Ameca splendens TaxID=208324 RepID=A0ABV0ZN08_9TELE
MCVIICVCMAACCGKLCLNATTAKQSVSVAPVSHTAGLQCCVGASLLGLCDDYYIVFVHPPHKNKMRLPRAGAHSFTSASPVYLSICVSVCPFWIHISSFSGL